MTKRRHTEDVVKREAINVCAQLLTVMKNDGHGHCTFDLHTFDCASLLAKQVVKAFLIGKPVVTHYTAGTRNACSWTMGPDDQLSEDVSAVTCPLCKPFAQADQEKV